MRLRVNYGQGSTLEFDPGEDVWGYYDPLTGSDFLTGKITLHQDGDWTVVTHRDPQ